MTHPIVVHKYGGSSVADAAKIKLIAARVAARRAQGCGMVVVVSAMGDTTDELLALAKQITPNPPRRELDMLLTAGERISMALLSMALIDAGTPAISFTGSQSGIITSDDHAQAEIIEVRPTRVREELQKGKVVIVAGYQGVSAQREVTTLGRGGSDTTAVALAAALSAQVCEICSDVDGVFSADPRVVPQARKLPELAYEEMQELARCGAKVLNAAAVEFARAKNICIQARSSFGTGTGTQILAAEGHQSVRAVATDAEMALVSAGHEVDAERLCALLRARGARPRELARSNHRRAWVISTADLHDADVADALAQGFGASLLTDVARVSAVGLGAGTERVSVAMRQAAMGCSAEIIEVDTQALSSSVFVPKAKLAQVACAAHTALIDAG